MNDPRESMEDAPLLVRSHGRYSNVPKRLREWPGERAERGPRKGMRLFVGAKGFSATEKIADLYEEYAAIVDEAVAADQSVPIGIASHE